MKIVLKIARAELRNMFYSPIAWLVIISIFVLIAASFAGGYTLLTRLQDVTLESTPEWTGFPFGISTIIALPQAIKLLQLLYLFIPLLTMGIINREVSSGTIKLLYSSPISTKDIVLGKYLAIVVLNVVLLVALCLFFIVACFTLDNPEIRWYGAMLLGLFLLLNTYAAIGIFISSLTSYPLVAAMLTFAAFFVLANISSLWQQYDFFRDVSYFLSISGKVELIMIGLITSREIIYFLLIIILFLGFTILKLNSTQNKVSYPLSFARYFGLLSVIVLIGYFSSKSGNIKYFDVTNIKTNTIVPEVQDVIGKLDGSPLKVTLYTNLLGRGAAYGLPQARNPYLWGFWEKYKRFYPNIELDYVYYYDVKDGDSAIYKANPGKTLPEIVEKQAEILGVRTSIFLRPEEVRQMVDLSKEDMGLIMCLEYKGKRELLRTYSDLNWPDETHVAGTLKRLMQKEEAKVAFLNGHYERDPYGFYSRDYSNHLTNKGSSNAGINLGFDTDTISIAEKDIPSDVNVLVIADPKSAYSNVEQDRITKYLEQGGNAIILGEPGKQALLNPVLKNLGIQLEEGIVVNVNGHEMPHFLDADVTNAGYKLSDETSFWEIKKYGKNKASIKLIGSSPIAINNSEKYKIEPVLTLIDREKTWIEKGKLVVDSAAPLFSVSEGDLVRDTLNMAVRLTRNVNGKEQRIVVVGDGDVMSNERFSGVLGHSFYSWTLYNEYPVYVNRPEALDRKFIINSGQSKIIQVIFLFVIPGLLLISSIVLLIRRKRK